MSSVTFRIVLVLSFAFPSATLLASQAWGTWRRNDSFPVLFSLDVTTGSVVNMVEMSSSLSVSPIYDLAADPMTQGTTVWAVRGYAPQNELIAMDPYRQILLSRVDLDAPEPIITLAIDPTSGEFYGTSETSLYRVASDTGATTLVGSTSLALDKGLGFDQQGNLYGVANRNHLIEVDKITAEMSVKAVLDVTRMEDIATRPEDGLMYGIGWGPGYDLYRIDPRTGGVASLGESVFRSSGLAFSAVPEPGTEGLGLAAFLVLVATRAGWRGSAVPATSRGYRGRS